MTYSKFFTLLAAMAGSIWSVTASALGHSRSLDPSVPGDSVKLKLRADSVAVLSPEELALLVEFIPNVPNDVIADRLSCIESDIPLVFNDFVRNFIDYFTIRNRKYTRTMLTRENVYFPLFERFLKKNDMPQELKYLSIVESGLNPRAKSHAGAVGLWQFMQATGREYGLEQTAYIDERMDPVKSTEAALKFLRRLYNYYDDWELALAAYNCGQGNVNKAIRKAGGGKKTFWEIFPYLPKETRGYVPSMTAVIYSMNYAAEHNIFSDSILYEPQIAHLEVQQALNLEKLAEELHMTQQELMALNPELKKPELPRNYKLRIPAQRAVLFASAEDKNCILLAASPAAKSHEPEESPVLLAAAKTAKEEKPAVAQKSVQQKVTYVVQRGDNLIQIAQQHDVSVEELKEWNNLKNNTIWPEQKLLVLQQSTAKETPVVLASQKESRTAAKQAQDVTEQLIHHVQPGDTLWNISQRYNGISVEQIKKLNKLKSNAIKPGQKLILS
ncbi:membrane-bound lytic murein transglycosylase D [Pontibacter ummariensis]|uniref:Membrane-bound lytic murein transglycosylase D n=1 Tax=Pontibacter ummariensis TaxID=1610492 RepID=A0A239HTG5_9BACT|nr:lytic transglycosylase domain-containing protein [Pontibacter ummariensis]PRY10428.1 membrane-bound lytic murein transglycosylase D [Pontibacter ummariensis]SNS84562.1 membrane-bound lytic murein transglycosylase D [Pontibacter ummariensis]